MKFPIYGQIKDVPNHQADMIWYDFFAVLAVHQNLLKIRVCPNMDLALGHIAYPTGRKHKHPQHWVRAQFSRVDPEREPDYMIYITWLLHDYILFFRGLLAS